MTNFTIQKQYNK